MNKSQHIVPVVLIAMVIMALSAHGQTTTGTITGQVVDASGAAVVGASVEATHVGTQSVRTTETGPTGEYLFTGLRGGIYKVKFEMEGFQTVLRSEIRILVNEVARIDVTLQPGALAQVVEVIGTPPALVTESGEIGGVIEHDTIVDLPLNGRNFIQLVALQPGGVSTRKRPGGGESFITSIFAGNFVVHGAQSEGTGYLLDGIEIRDAVDTRVGIQITVDAVQEFKFQALNYDASFGRASGGQVNITSRSGSNEYHGTVWEFLRNDNMDARNFFAGEKPEFKRNQFGAAGGGAIVKDKLFVFGSYEGFRESKGITRLVTVPSLRQRAGDFSEDSTQIKDPLTGADFVGNQIPLAQHSQVALKTFSLGLFPLPDRLGVGQNLTGVANQEIDTDQVNVRVDYIPRPEVSFFGHFTIAEFNRTFPFVFTSLPNFSSVWNSPAATAVLGYTHTFGANTINELRYGFNRHTQILEDLQQTERINDQLGIPGLTQDPRFQGNPNLRITGVSATGVISNAPNNRTDNQFMLLDNFSHVRGSHSLKMGASLQWDQQNGGSGPSSHGVFTFDGSFSGNPVADFLLGFPKTTARCCNVGDGFRNFRKVDVGIYFQDNWKVSPTLTLNLGLRWEFYQAPTEIRDHFSNPDLTAAPNAVFRLAGVGGVPRDLRDTSDKNNFGPRFGFAYSLGAARKTVIRGGYGLFFNSTNLVYTFGHASNPPFANRDSITSVLDPITGPTLTMADPFPAALIVSGTSFSAIDPEFYDAYNQNWNLTVQREVGFGTVFSMSYIGNKGTGLNAREQVNPAPIGPSTVRRIPGFSSINIRRNRGKSIYHGLELKAEKRFGGGLGFLGSFVWSKCIDASGTQILGDGSPGLIRDQSDISQSRGLCQADVRRRAVGNFIYDLPMGRGMTGAAKAAGSRLADYLDHFSRRWAAFHREGCHRRQQHVHWRGHRRFGSRARSQCGTKDPRAVVQRECV